MIHSTAFERACRDLKRNPRRWLVTGVAGFIGSNLLEVLLRLDQHVVGLDNLATGSKRNLDEVRDLVDRGQFKRFKFIRGDITNLEVCTKASRRVDFVLHLAALGSVPFSLEKPLEAHQANVNGFCNMVFAARRNRVRRFVYSSSSAVYGDHPGLPKVENETGHCLSPYATTKVVNELYAGVFARCYDMETVGLRYFNVFGPRQNPNGPYAAVIPRWIQAMIRNEPVFINGDGKTSRDFCYVANVVQANLLAATCQRTGALNQVYNVAAGGRTTLNELFRMLLTRLKPFHPHLRKFSPIYREFRPGDVRHSEADISKAGRLLGYVPSYRVDEGLDEALQWYRNNLT